MKKSIRILIVLLLFVVSCGKKGPLYLPKKDNDPQQKEENVTNTKDSGKQESSSKPINPFLDRRNETK